MFAAWAGEAESVAPPSARTASAASRIRADRWFMTCLTRLCWGVSEVYGPHPPGGGGAGRTG
ncbi:hypothetical protein GCM10010126_38810 [Planomonospora parontospora]|uniref:Uncharacterized protein n=1 Tax=Planomonospora parontospora TaxID=58119 RepID=A0AA37BIY7_9ACTN|nr:hypothetical protein GCM10010126_38810 [Planomonospora parontospora]